MLIGSYPSATVLNHWRKQTLATVSRRLDEQLERARRVFKYGEYDWETFCARRDRDHRAEAPADLVRGEAANRLPSVVRSTTDGPGGCLGGR